MVFFASESYTRYVKYSYGFKNIFLCSSSDLLLHNRSRQLEKDDEAQTQAYFIYRLTFYSYEQNLFFACIFLTQAVSELKM
jgi:hypothetical protein